MGCTKQNLKNFKGKRILAIDYGTKNTGLALFDVDQDITPYPYKNLISKNEKKLIEEILQLVDYKSINVVILGIPRLLDGQETKMSNKIRNFGIKLKKKVENTLDIFFQDETLSSYEAQERMKNSPLYNFKVDPKKLDELAATIILEDFLKNINDAERA